MPENPDGDLFDFSDVPDLISAWPCRPSGCGPDLHEGLPPRGAYALWATAQVVADEWRESLAELGRLGEQDRPAADPRFGELPPVARRLATPAWLARFITCFDDLAQGIATGSLELACTGEEVAFQILLDRCGDMLAAGDELVVPPGWNEWPEHGEGFDFDLERVETIICADIDVPWLWQPEMDGIESGDGITALLMRPVNPHPRDWFTAFAEVAGVPAPGPVLPPSR